MIHKIEKCYALKFFKGFGNIVDNFAQGHAEPNNLEAQISLCGK